MLLTKNANSSTFGVISILTQVKNILVLLTGGIIME